MQKALKFKILIEVERDGEEFYAHCPHLPGLHVGGATEQEAIRNAADAALAYMRSILKHDDPIPLGVLDESEMRSPWQRLAQDVGELFRPHVKTRHTKELCLAP